MDSHIDTQFNEIRRLRATLVSKVHVWSTKEEAIEDGLQRLSQMELSAQKRLNRIRRHRKALLDIFKTGDTK